MPVVKMLQDWRDYKVNQVVDELNERVCAELITAGFAENYATETIDINSMKTSLGYKYATLKSVETMISYYEKELERLKNKKEVILEDIDVVESEIANEGKDIKKKTKINRNKED